MGNWTLWSPTSGAFDHVFCPHSRAFDQRFSTIVNQLGDNEVNMQTIYNDWHSVTVNIFFLHAGTVIRATKVKMLEYEREYICCRCKHVFTTTADFEQFYVIPKPSKCPSANGCTSTKFTCLSDTGKGLMKWLPCKMSPNFLVLVLKSTPPKADTLRTSSDCPP